MSANLNTIIGRPRMRVYHEDADGIEARYAGHTLHINRRGADSRWYIVVLADSGERAYDGWWPDSEGEPINAAIREALYGACIVPRPPRPRKQAVEAAL